MGRLVKVLLGLAIATAVGAVALIYLSGPHAEVSAAFEDYKAAYVAGETSKVTVLTSQADKLFWDQQRRHALKSSEEIVKAQDYKRRGAVLKLRSDVLDGKLALFDLQTFDPEQLYAATREPAAFSKALSSAFVLFAVPTGNGKARGYLRLAQIKDYSALQMGLALLSGSYLNFERDAGGSYKIDPTPLLDQGAYQAESLALQVEPTGNKFLVQGLLRSGEIDREQKLWSPLIKE